MLIKTFIKEQGASSCFILRNRRGEILDRADAELDANGRLVVKSKQDGSCYASFSAWRAVRTSYANTYDMITTEDGILLRTIANGGQRPAFADDDEITPDEDIGATLALAERFCYRLYHGHTPLEYVEYMKHALEHDLHRHANLVGAWPKVADRTLREAVKAHIRFQYGLRWADKTQPCLYRERGGDAAFDRGDETAMDHVIPVSTLAAAVLELEEAKGFDRRFATLVRAWLCPVAHITKESHGRLTADSSPKPIQPFTRYAQVNIIAEDYEGRDVKELTLEQHFETLNQIGWVAPILKEYIYPHKWNGLIITE